MPKIKPVLVRFKEEEYKKVLENAKLYTDGNITAWIVYCSTNHEPSPEELV